MINSGITVTTIAPGYIKTTMTDINQYPMPFLINVNIASEKFALAIRKKRRFVVIPWQMGILANIMRFLPAAVWDLLAKNAPVKERTQWDWL